MENWLKHELFHSNNEVSWWHDMTRDNMSSHDIRHMTYVTRQGMTYGHKIWHLTSCICRCEWTGTMILLPFRTIFRSRNIFTIAHWVTFTHAFTHDLETGGHVMVYVTFVISACICPIAMIFLLFRKDLRSGNSFQLSPFAWPSRLTLKLNVTSWSTWHMSFLPVFVLPQRLFFVLQRFWVREFILTIATRVTFTYDLETQGHVMVYVTFVISGHLYVSYRNDFLFCQVFRSRNSFWLLPLAWPSWVTLKRKVPSWSTCFNNLKNQKVT